MRRSQEARPSRYGPRPGATIPPPGVSGVGPPPPRSRQMSAGGGSRPGLGPGGAGAGGHEPADETTCSHRTRGPGPVPGPSTFQSVNGRSDRPCYGHDCHMAFAMWTRCPLQTLVAHPISWMTQGVWLAKRSCFDPGMDLKTRRNASLTGLLVPLGPDEVDRPGRGALPLEGNAMRRTLFVLALLTALVPTSRKPRLRPGRPTRPVLRLQHRHRRSRRCPPSRHDPHRRQRDRLLRRQRELQPASGPPSPTR